MKDWYLIHIGKWASKLLKFESIFPPPQKKCWPITKYSLLKMWWVGSGIWNQSRIVGRMSSRETWGEENAIITLYTCTLYSVHCTPVLCTLYTVHCTLYTVHTAECQYLLQWQSWFYVEILQVWGVLMNTWVLTLEPWEAGCRGELTNNGWRVPGLSRCGQITSLCILHKIFSCLIR